MGIVQLIGVESLDKLALIAETGDEIVFVPGTESYASNVPGNARRAFTSVNHCEDNCAVALQSPQRP